MLISFAGHGQGWATATSGCSPEEGGERGRECEKCCSGSGWEAARLSSTCACPLIGGKMSSLGGQPRPCPARTLPGSTRALNLNTEHTSCGPVQCGPRGWAGLKDCWSCPAGISHFMGDLLSTHGQTIHNRGGRRKVGGTGCLSWGRSDILKANTLSLEDRNRP